MSSRDTSLESERVKRSGALLCAPIATTSGIGTCACRGLSPSGVNRSLRAPCAASSPTQARTAAGILAPGASFSATAPSRSENASLSTSNVTPFTVSEPRGLYT